MSLLHAAGLPVEDFSESIFGDFLVASSGPVVAGLLRSLAVDPGVRDAGIGRRLVSELEARASRRGIEELWLLTIDADRYFSKLGYRVQERHAAPEVIRQTAEFSRLCPDDALLMKKKL